MKLFKYQILLFCLIVLLIINNNFYIECKILQNNNKISKQIHSYYLPEHYKENSHYKTKLWVFFNKKYSNNNSNNNDIELIKNIKIGEKSRERRVVRGNLDKESIIDYYDIPVNNDFINEIINKCTIQNTIEITSHKTSKWLNSVSISLNTHMILRDYNNKNKFISNKDNDKLIQETIQCISNFNFVDKIDIVSQFIRDHPNIKQKNRIEEKEDLISLAHRKTSSTRKLSSKNDNTYDQSFYGKTFSGIQQINIPQLQSQGFDGTNITILMIDSGFYKDHNAFKQMKIIAEYDFINNQSNVTSPLGNDQNKHGTATLSTIGGYVPGILVGPAYNANFLLAKTEIVSEEERIEEDYWIHALEWGEQNGAELVSSSLGYTKWYNYSELNSLNAPITIAADIAAAKGMVVVISAGNNDNSGIGAPADGKNVIAVGALYLDGNQTHFSSLGPASDGRVKPDISALGYQNFVANHLGPNEYTYMSGTSFACPLAAGAIALLMQSQPTWTRQQIYDAVIRTASTTLDPNIKIGYGILNISNAFYFNSNSTLDGSSGSCTTNGCSGHGGCCSNLCYCAPDRYGSNCQYSKIECSYECGARGGKCQMDEFGYTFNCVDLMAPNYSDYNPRDICSACDGTLDKCGVCGGNSSVCVGCDGLPFSDKVIDSCGVCGGNGECKTTVVIVDQPEVKSQFKLLLGLSIGGIATLCLVVATIVLYRKRKILSISSDGTLPFLKGYSKLENLDNNNFSIDENDIDINY